MEVGNKVKMSGIGEYKFKVVRNNKIYEIYKDFLGFGVNEFFV